MLLIVALALLVSTLVAATFADSYRRSYYAERRNRAADDAEAAKECAEFAAQRDDAVRALRATQAEVGLLKATVELRDGDLASVRAEVEDLLNEVTIANHHAATMENANEDLCLENYALQDELDRRPAAPKAKRASKAKAKAKK